ncbi:MAG: SDR family oxidoreductase [Hyphomicrobiaceae bacterium]
MAEKRVALVTGANRGIGHEIVRQLAQRGFVAVLGARDPAKGHAAAEALKAEGLDTPAIVLDVADSGSVTRAVAEIMQLFGRIDALVNNAGVLLDGASAVRRSLLDVPIDVAIRTLDINTIGPLRLMQAVLPIMRARNYGRVVNISSGLGQLTYMGNGYTAYRVSKAALNALTRIAAAEIGPGNIKINTMHPGWVRTDMGGPNAERPVAKGAETAVWLATLPDDGPTGGFFQDRRPMVW